MDLRFLASGPSPAASRIARAENSTLRAWRVVSAVLMLAARRLAATAATE